MALGLRRFKIIIAVAVTLSLCVESGGQVPGEPDCPVMTIAEGASRTLLSKTWFENRRLFNSDPDFPTPSCVTYTFGTLDEQNIMTVTINEIYKDNNATAKMDGVLMPINGSFSSYDVNIYIQPILPKRYDILGFDPEGNWVVIWTCRSFPEVSFQQALVLSTQRNPDPQTLEPAMAILRSNNLPDTLFAKSDQDDCKEKVDI